MKPIAIVPARGGSKRIPRKNIRPFLGVPLIARTLGTLLQSEIFDRVVVSTDDVEIAEVSIAAGAEAPFSRPPELADDYTPTARVIQHAVDWLETDSGRSLDDICVAYPAAVFVTPAQLRAAHKQLHAAGVDMVFSALAFDSPIQRAWRTRPDGNAEMLWPDNRLTRSQDLEPTFHDAGQFYWAHRDFWASDGAGQTWNVALFAFQTGAVIDIDTLDDWHQAEEIYAKRHRPHR